MSKNAVSVARPWASGGGTAAPASGGNLASPGATRAEQAIDEAMRGVIANLVGRARAGASPEAKARIIEAKIVRRVNDLEVAKRRIIHTPEGRVRTLNESERAQVSKMNRSLDRANRQLIRLHEALRRFHRRQGGRV